jgi:hypothetical protein
MRFRSSQNFDSITLLFSNYTFEMFMWWIKYGNHKVLVEGPLVMWWILRGVPVHVGPILGHTTLRNLSFIRNGASSLAIVPATKDKSASMLPLDEFTSLVMSYLMRMIFLSHNFTQMQELNFMLKFFSFLQRCTTIMGMI